MLLRRVSSLARPGMRAANARVARATAHGLPPAFLVAPTSVIVLGSTRVSLFSAGPSSSPEPPQQPQQPTTTGGHHRTFSGPVSWATLALVVAAGAGVVIYNNVAREKKKSEASTKVETYGKPMLGGPWSLVDSEGRPLSSGDLHGGYTLLYFGFTFCPDICPNELVKMGKVTSGIEERFAKSPVPTYNGRPVITPVFITLDPYRDSCAQVGAYVRDFHPRMIGLTGTPAQIAKVAKKFRVYFQEVDHAEGEDDYLVDHSIVMYLMSPEGEFMEFFTQLMTAPEITDKIEKVIRNRAAKK